MLAVAAGHLEAQQDTLVTTLGPVVVTVTRGAGRSVLGSPFAITVVEPDSSRPGQRHASVDETVAMVPGLSATSRNNPAQDPRVSIRGFGARSAFGVRGIRVLRDGMPLTLPDGQTPLDYLSLESVGRVEVLRGAASALYGNASGGVIDFRTIVPSASAVSLDAKQWIGSSSLSRSVLSGSGSYGNFHYVGDASHLRTDGSRAHSTQRATSGFARAGITAGSTDYAISVLALDNPVAENPGALTIEEMTADPKMADALSVRRKARKAVKQIQIGASAARSLEKGEISLSVFGGARSLDNPLTFGIVEIGRHTYGLTGAFRREIGLFRTRHLLAAGADLQSQNDLRRNYATCADTVPLSSPTATCPSIEDERGVVTLDQRELVSSAGVYVSDEMNLGKRASVTGGVRADRVRFEVRDRLVTTANPDDSGRRTLGAVSPVLGVLARLTPTQSAYANVSAAFETPTATELGNHADGSAGMNPDLDPQRSTTVEIGLKGWAGGAMRYDVALFDTQVRDELVPFEIPDSNGRRYFRNAGRTRRRGAEAGMDVSAGPVSVMLAYSYSRFRFGEYAVAGSDFSGNEIPGIPRHRMQASIRAGRDGTFAVLESEVAGRTYVDDANSVRSPGYAVSTIRFGATPFRVYSRFSVVTGVQNIFDRVYAASIAVNAARGKYYEPAPRRTFFAGVSLGAQTRRY